jgi:hypothetical protein
MAFVSADRLVSVVRIKAERNVEMGHAAKRAEMHQKSRKGTRVKA